MTLEPLPYVLQRITQVRSEYTSARHIYANLEHRAKGSRYPRYQGYLPAQIDYQAQDGQSYTISIRDYDVRFLDRIASSEAREHVNRIHLARSGHAEARRQMADITRDLHGRMRQRFSDSRIVENEYVVPYTSGGTFDQEQISHKGLMLLDLSRRGLATSDFTLLTANAFRLNPTQREGYALQALENLERLTGRKLGDPANPLLIAMRCAMPGYIPGFMPTWLNVGLTPDVLPGLPERYGAEATSRIRLNSRKTLLEEVDLEAFRSIEPRLCPGLSMEANHALAEEIEALIERRFPRLLTSAHCQVLFLLDRAHTYYQRHLDTLRNFMGRKQHLPTMIFQRMVCSVLDDDSYAGVLYSRHSRTGQGVHLQYARTIFGEDLMTGRLVPCEETFLTREDARERFPAVYHFWPRLAQLEEILAAPVMVEFTGVHGTFTLLQLNEAELSGIGMLSAVIDMHRSGLLSGERVRSIIRPYHVRQIESDAIDPKSLARLDPYCNGVPVLPRSAVTGRLTFSGARAREARTRWPNDKVILAKSRFNPTDAIHMAEVNGILSVSPAAIHVVTTAQNLGIPALLNLEAEGVRIVEADGSDVPEGAEGGEGCFLVNRAGRRLKEGDWVTLSSRQHAVFVGQAAFAPARLLRFMAGEPVEFTDAERRNFERWASYYKEYRFILENADVSEFASLQDLGHAIRYGRLKEDAGKAREFVNLCFDLNRASLVERLLDATLGSHQMNLTAFRLLEPDHQATLLKEVVATCRQRGLNGYQAGSFVVGSLVVPDSPVSWWRRFAPEHVALLLSEWLYHQKYMALLSDVGEQKVNRARDRILSQGLGRLSLHRGVVSPFASIKLARVDLAQVKAALPPGADSQASELLDLLARPYGALFDFDKAWSVAPLKRLCEAEGIPLPDPQDT